MRRIICDQCGLEMNDRWEIEGMAGTGGTCTECGANLCAKCGGKWGEDGKCRNCSITLEELEYNLPLTIQRSEKKEMPCPDCKRDVNVTVTYEQRIYRSDDFSNNRKKRTYGISYVMQYSHEKVLFRTERYRNFRGALLEAHKKLEQMGLKPNKE